VSLDEQNYADVKKLVIEQQEQIKTLNETIAKLTAKPEVPHVQVDGNVTGIDPADIAAGRILVTMKEPEKVEPKNGEVSFHDQKALNNSIADIASGKVRVVG
jgi:hypothetical protein